MGDSQGIDDHFWLFGYGSLIWKPPPHYDQRLPGYIEGYVRRFWQASEDHRGTPEAPGRVVTLIDRKHWESLSDNHHGTPEVVWGAAYHIPAAKVAEVRSYLDIREINGYSIQYTPFHPVVSWRTHDKDDPANASSNGNNSRGAGPIQCLVYIGLPENPQFMGPQDPQTLSEHILASRGPSGENKEYLYMLESSLLELSPESGDDHISDLARRCRTIEAEQGQSQATSGGDPQRDGDSLDTGLRRVGSTEEQEEVEKMN